VGEPVVARDVDVVLDLVDDLLGVVAADDHGHSDPSYESCDGDRVRLGGLWNRLTQHDAQCIRWTGQYRRVPQTGVAAPQFVVGPSLLLKQLTWQAGLADDGRERAAP